MGYWPVLHGCIIRMIRATRMTWAVHTALMREKKIYAENLIWKLVRKRPLRNPKHRYCKIKIELK
jgi:hypothetical protein